MPDLQLSTPLLLCTLPFIIIVVFFNSITATLRRKSSLSPNQLPKSYPILGSALAIVANKDRRIQWTAEILKISPSSTFVLHRPLGTRIVFTANPSNVHHILKSHFHLYDKGSMFRATLSDLLGDGIFNADGETWRFQRQVASHEFSTKSLRTFVEQVVVAELHRRLIPILVAASREESVLDLQDILQRFAFDNICKIAFGYDPEYLSPSLPQERFAQAFEDATMFIVERLTAIFPIVWRLKRFFNVGSERRVRIAVKEVLDFAKKMVREKQEVIERGESLDSVDLLSRFLSSGHSDEKFVTDIVVSFILAGRDTTSAALTWFFWLISRNPSAEGEILEEIRGKSESPVMKEVKEMAYTQAALCESMRLYPPVPVDTKEALADDVLPTGTVVRKGMRVAYHPYAMGRSEELWGEDWPEFKPERWLEGDKNRSRNDGAAAGEGGDGGEGKEGWRFVGRDVYEYPVFQAGPRICLGKEMAFLQMKRVAAGVLRRFMVVPAEEGFEPVFVSYLTSKMKGGFPVRVYERVGDYKFKSK